MEPLRGGFLASWRLGLVLHPGPRHGDHGARGVQLDAHPSGPCVTPHDDPGGTRRDPHRMGARQGSPQADALPHGDGRGAPGRPGGPGPMPGGGSQEQLEKAGQTHAPTLGSGRLRGQDPASDQNFGYRTEGSPSKVTVTSGPRASPRTLRAAPGALGTRGPPPPPGLTLRPHRAAPPPRGPE